MIYLRQNNKILNTDLPNVLQYSNMNIQIEDVQEYPKNPAHIIGYSRISDIGCLFVGYQGIFLNIRYRTLDIPDHYRI